MRRLVLLLPPVFMVAACAAPEGAFPSLARRPIEALDPAAEPVRAPAPAAAPDPGVAVEVAAAVAAAEAGERRFREVLAAEAAAVRAGAGTAPSSDRWAAAQLALSRVQSARDGTMDALAQLETLGDQAARAHVMALDAAQARDVAALARLLPEP